MTFDAFLREACADDDKKVCEVALEHGKDGVLWVDLQGKRVAQSGGSESLCRLAVSDITALKRASGAQERAEALKTMNETLEVEVARRKTSEKSLRKSKRRQSGLLEESESMQDQLRLLSHEILHVQEVERRCISRDLHDEIAQTLVAINVHLSSLAGDAAVGTARMQRKIRERQKLVEKSVESVHRFAMGLRPTMLDDLGLVSALRACAHDFRKETEVPVNLELSGNLKPLTGEPAVALYRVAQAALSNIARHAEATEVRLSLRQTQRALHLEIADNGKGFKVKGARSGEESNRLGLIGMRERAEMVGARFDIASKPGKGATISVRLPLAKACPPPLASTPKKPS